MKHCPRPRKTSRSCGGGSNPQAGDTVAVRRPHVFVRKLFAVGPRRRQPCRFISKSTDPPAANPGPANGRLQSSAPGPKSLKTASCSERHRGAAESNPGSRLPSDRKKAGETEWKDEAGVCECVCGGGFSRCDHAAIKTTKRAVGRIGDE